MLGELPAANNVYEFLTFTARSLTRLHGSRARRTDAARPVAGDAQG